MYLYSYFDNIYEISDLIRMTFIVTQKSDILTIPTTAIIIVYSFLYRTLDVKNAKNFPEIRLQECMIRTSFI